MKFNEEIAKEIASRHGIADTTIRVWKNRGKIPQKYFRSAYKKPETVKEDSLIQRIREIQHTAFRSGILNHNYKSAAQRMQDVKEGAFITEEEKIKIKTEIIEIRNKCRKAMDTRGDDAIHILATDKRIKPTIVLSPKFYDRIIRKSFIEDNMKDEIILLIITFYNRISI